MLFKLQERIAALMRCAALTPSSQAGAARSFALDPPHGTHTYP
jgi:hypothetical protein